MAEPTSSKEERPRLYLKADLRNAPKRSMLDFRTGHEVNGEDETRRMTREKIPDMTTTSKVNEIGRFFSIDELGMGKVDRLRKLVGVFTDERMDKVVVPIISVTSRISLRALDWLVINYSKKHKIALVNDQSHLLSVYDDYRAWLRYWKRGLFDAFRRGPRVFFEHKGYVYSTTVAQLNFLYWCEKNGILHYAISHLDEIEADMNERINECKREKELMHQAGYKRKRCELSRAPTIKCLVYNVPVTIHF